MSFISFLDSENRLWKDIYPSAGYLLVFLYRQEDDALVEIKISKVSCSSHPWLGSGRSLPS